MQRIFKKKDEKSAKNKRKRLYGIIWNYMGLYGKLGQKTEISVFGLAVSAALATWFAAFAKVSTVACKKNPIIKRIS